MQRRENSNCVRNQETVSISLWLQEKVPRIKMDVQEEEILGISLDGLCVN